MAFGKFSVTMPIEVVASGGLRVRQVDVNGAALDDSTDIYSIALPVTLVDANGANENGTAAFGVWLKVTLASDGVAIVRCDSAGNAVSTPLDGTPTIPTLLNLSLNTASVAENSANGTVVGTIQNKSASSVLSLVNDAGGRFALSGNDVVRTAVALNYEATPTNDIVVRETLAGASNTPHDNTITITTTNVLETTLNAITLPSQNPLPENASALHTIGSLSGTTSGSTLTLTDSEGGRIAIQEYIPGVWILYYNGGGLDYETEPTLSVTVRETHADGSNSPRDSVISIDVTDVDDNAPANTGDPVISGGDEIGDTLTVVDDGTWDHSPTSYERFWFSSPTPLFEGAETELDPDSMTSYGPLDASLEGLYIACKIVASNAYGSAEAWSNVLGPIVDAADVTPPSLSSQSGTASSSTTANLFVTTNEDNGTLYWVVTTSSTSPSAAQVKAGQNHAGATASYFGSQVIFSAGGKEPTASGLTASTVYYAHFMHEDASSNQSSVVSTTSFTTDVAPAMLAPVLTATTTTENPPEWDSDFEDFEIYDGSANGDEHRLIWRLGGAGGWTTEAWQGLDDELLSGGFTWPLWEAAMPYAAGGTVEVKEQRRRLAGGVQTLISDESNTLTFTVDAIATPWTLDDLSTPLYHWWDARDISTLFTDSARTIPVTTDGDLIGAADNKGSSGSGANATQATAGNRIPYEATSGINSLPAFDSPGTSNRALNITTSMGSLAELTFNGGLTSLELKLDSTSHIFSTGVSGLNSPHVLYFEWTSGAGSATAKLYINGVLKETKTGLTIVNDGFFVALADADSAGMSNLGRYIHTQRLFNRSLDGQRNFDGQIVTLGYGDYVPSTGEREKIEGHLCHAGGITLPSGHTYEDNPPTI